MGMEYVNADLNNLYSIVDKLFSRPYNTYSLL